MPGSALVEVSLRHLGAALFAGGFLIGCAPGMEILSRTVLTGSVNSAPVQARVEATITVNQGGRTTCEFSQLPTGFNPATFGTHT
jgi:hypothetical protein